MPTLGTVTRILRPSFPPPPPRAPASSESYSGPLHNLLPPQDVLLRLQSEISYCGFAQAAHRPRARTRPLAPSKFMRFRTSRFLYSSRRYVAVR